MIIVILSTFSINHNISYKFTHAMEGNNLNLISDNNDNSYKSLLKPVNYNNNNTVRNSHKNLSPPNLNKSFYSAKNNHRNLTLSDLYESFNSAKIESKNNKDLPKKDTDIINIIDAIDNVDISEDNKSIDDNYSLDNFLKYINDKENSNKIYMDNFSNSKTNTNNMIPYNIDIDKLNDNDNKHKSEYLFSNFKNFDTININGMKHISKEVIEKLKSYANIKIEKFNIKNIIDNNETIKKINIEASKNNYKININNLISTEKINDITKIYHNYNICINLIKAVQNEINFNQDISSKYDINKITFNIISAIKKLNKFERLKSISSSLYKK